MTKIPDTLTNEKMAAALKNSGYLLEMRLENVLRDRKYYVSANCSYPDPISGKTREFDMFAAKSKSAGPRDYEEVTSNLIIECINNPYPMAFFKKKPIAAFPILYDNKMSGIPLKVFREKENDWMPLRLFINILEYHHYYAEAISTQYCTFTQKKTGESKQWMAFHDDDHFDALKKLTIVIEYLLKKDYADWTIKPECPVLLWLYYPILVVQGELIYVEEKDGNVIITPVDHVVYCVSNIVGNREDMYTIDVIKEQYMGTYLEILEREMNETSFRLNTIHDNLKDSIKRLSEIVNQSLVAGRTSIDLRKLLEPERMFK